LHSVSPGDKSIRTNERNRPEEWWFANFSKEIFTPDGGAKTVIDYPAPSVAPEKSFERGMYNDDLLLGVGAHLDDGHAIVNTGRAIVTPDGRVSTYEEYNGHIHTAVKMNLRLMVSLGPVKTGKTSSAVANIHL
jgi:hypothetical protein